MSPPHLEPFHIAQSWNDIPRRSPGFAARGMPDLRSPTADAGPEARHLEELARLAGATFPNVEPASAREHEKLAWLQDLYSLVSKSDIDRAIDVLFQRVDDMLSEGAFAKCDEMLRAVDLKRLDSNLLVALLTITLPAAPKLSFRSRLVQRVENVLKAEEPDRVDRLLEGLR